MKRLLLILTILASANSLHGMNAQKQQVDSVIDFSKLPPITLPQIYHHLAEVLLPEIAQHIFSLHPYSSNLNDDIFPSKEDKENAPTYIVRYMNTSLRYLDNWLAVELLERNFLRKGISICDIKDNNSDITLLHCASSSRYTKVAKLFLQVAGNNAWTLLSAQTKNTQTTALHYAVGWLNFGDIGIIKLLLDAAGDDAQILMNIRNHEGNTAFDLAKPQIKEVMRQYLKNNQ